MEAAREAMQRERAERLKAIQLEVGGDEVRTLERVMIDCCTIAGIPRAISVQDFVKIVIAASSK